LSRYESPSQHTARLAPEDTILVWKRIRKRQAVIAVMAAGNRDQRDFLILTALDITRADNRHLAFGGRRTSALARRWRGSKVRLPLELSCAGCLIGSSSPHDWSGAPISDCGV